MTGAEGIVQIEQGRLRGRLDAGVWSFRGVPYAAPPVGARRWRPPARPLAWDGVREALRFGPVAPQGIGSLQALGGRAEPHDEDCLLLNVWTPSLEEPVRPVLVFVHGGSFVSGSGSSGLYRGGMLASEGDVVVVTLNYRLGLLGFLSHPVLASEETWLDGERWQGTGNFGLADQMAALRWVRDNIAAFGGDPTQVTLFGESAGGMSVADLLAVPEARPLFHRAIVQSGPPVARTAAAAAEQAGRMAGELGLPLTRAALEGVSAETLVEWVLHTREADGDGLVAQPVIDGGLVSGHPLEAVAEGAAAEIPLLAGTTRDEWSFFLLGRSDSATLDEEGLLRRIGRLLPDEATAVEVIEAVRAARMTRGETVTPAALLTAVVTEQVFRLPTQRLLDAHAAGAAPGVGTFGYLFTWESPLFAAGSGSCHALELPFVFGSVELPPVQLFSGGGDEALALSAEMRRSWVTFARTGRLAEAPNWEPGRRPTTVFGPWPGAPGLRHQVDAPRAEEVDALDHALPPGT